MSEVLLHHYRCFDCSIDLYTSSLQVPWHCQGWMDHMRAFELEVREI